MLALQEHYYSEEDYLSAERKAEFKSEYFKGEVFAMGNLHSYPYFKY